MLTNSFPELLEKKPEHAQCVSLKQDETASAARWELANTVLLEINAVPYCYLKVLIFFPNFTGVQ